MQPTRQCLCCRTDKPVSEFPPSESRHNYGAPTFSCRTCRAPGGSRRKEKAADKATKRAEDARAAQEALWALDPKLYHCSTCREHKRRNQFGTWMSGPRRGGAKTRCLDCQALKKSPIPGPGDLRCRCCGTTRAVADYSYVLSGRKRGRRHHWCNACREQPDSVAKVHICTGIRTNAKTRGHYFPLLDKEVVAFMSLACFYCGRFGVNLNTPTGFRWNGIDRLDSSGMYEPANMVPCCGPCNLAKSRSSTEDYLNLCALVASRATAILAQLPPMGASGNSAEPRLDANEDRTEAPFDVEICLGDDDWGSDGPEDQWSQVPVITSEIL